MNGTAISLGSTCNRPADEHGAKGKEESHPYSLLICELKWIMALFALLRKPKGKSSPLKLKKKGRGEELALGRAQWLEHRPSDWRVVGSNPSQGMYLGSGSIPGRYRRQPTDV